MKIKHKGIIAVVLFLFIAVVSALVLTLYNGVILLNNPSVDKYPVRGVDVSSYQGEIDWNVLSGSNIQFAYIKATEGSSFVDPKFEYNYLNANKTTLRIGAYHFFSYDSSGENQADNFISVVKKTDNMLPPVVDIEFYGDKEKIVPDKESTHLQLKTLLQKLENYYGMKPVIYATQKSYKLYVAEDFDDYGIWIRNVLTTPGLSDNRNWTFWQYTDREKLEGYNGEEKFIDVNVFNGTTEEFVNYAK